MSDQMSLAGYGCNSQGYLNPNTQQLDYNMPFTGDPGTTGMPVTVGAFFGMLNNFFKLLVDNPQYAPAFQGRFYVDFSKASLFRILSQSGCEFVRFHFAVPNADSKISLVAHGLTADKEILGYDQLLAKATNNDMTPAFLDPAIEERGNGDPIPGVLLELFRLLREQGSPLATVDLDALLGS
ncbi:hypothetical protein [Chitinophaga sp. 180180018-3]|jgi:hypothetical protein|uniref:hypothetical protein n=1 Tax=unclassified Chitinophaga TaxID=2619133 RepID=UPI0030D1BFE0